MENMSLLAILFIFVGISTNILAIAIGKKPKTDKLPNPQKAQAIMHVVGMVDVAIGAIIIALT